LKPFCNAIEGPHGPRPCSVRGSKLAGVLPSCSPSTQLTLAKLPIERFAIETLLEKIIPIHSKPSPFACHPHENHIAVSFLKSLSIYNGNNMTVKTTRNITQ
jgi:hypothetical protein